MKAVLFDLDGTLLDTVGDLQRSLNETLTEFGYDTVTREQTANYVGDGAKQLVCRALPKNADNCEDVYRSFRNRYAKTDDALSFLYEGEVAFLKRLQERGIKIGVVTNKPQEAAERVLKDKLADIAFDFIAGDSGNFPRKPDPTVGYFAALSLRVSPGECVFVGDGEPDVQFAKNAGMRGISCLWGYRSKQQLLAVGATEFVTSFDELEQLLLG